MFHIRNCVMSCSMICTNICLLTSGVIMLLHNDLHTKLCVNILNELDIGLHNNEVMTCYMNCTIICTLTSGVTCYTSYTMVCILNCVHNKLCYDLLYELHQYLHTY